MHEHSPAKPSPIGKPDCYHQFTFLTIFGKTFLTSDLKSATALAPRAGEAFLKTLSASICALADVAQRISSTSSP